MCEEKAIDFLSYNELISEKNGGKIIFATDDWFAVAENMLKDEEPVWKTGLYTDFGKWMDGWETRRKRTSGHDWVIIALKFPAIIKGFCVDTSYFTGNYAPKISIQAAKINPSDVNKFPTRQSKIGSEASEVILNKIEYLKTKEWKTIVPVNKLKAGYPETRLNYFHSTSDESWNYLRLNIFPDGGIARLRAYGKIIASVKINNNNFYNLQNYIDLIGRENGGICVEYSNAHYGHPRNLIKFENSSSMADGWETARYIERHPVIELDSSGFIKSSHFEWVIFKLGHVGVVKTIVIDTTHFKGNYPDNVKVEGFMQMPSDFTNNNNSSQLWKSILPMKKLQPHKSHIYNVEDFIWYGPISHIKIIITPDGGLSRVRVWGNISNSFEDVYNHNKIIM